MGKQDIKQRKQHKETTVRSGAKEHRGSSAAGKCPGSVGSVNSSHFIIIFVAGKTPHLVRTPHSLFCSHKRSSRFYGEQDCHPMDTRHGGVASPDPRKVKAQIKNLLSNSSFASSFGLATTERVWPIRAQAIIVITSHNTHCHTHHVQLRSAQNAHALSKIL